MNIDYMHQYIWKSEDAQRIVTVSCILETAP